MKKHNIVHAVGDPGLSEAEREQLRKAIRRRENYIIRLAEKFSHCPETVRKLVHEEFGPAPLRKGRIWLPLSSDFPQREVRRQIAAYVAQYGGTKKPMSNAHDHVSEETLFLLDLIVRRGFAGKLPDNHTAFAELVADLCVRQIPRETWDTIGTKQEIVRHSFALQFIAAAESLRIANQTSEAVAWTN